jgi:hypothetical protein
MNRTPDTFSCFVPHLNRNKRTVRNHLTEKQRSQAVYSTHTFITNFNFGKQKGSPSVFSAQLAGLTISLPRHQ